MNNKKPMVSILIPAYNAQDYLPQCIDSILSQTYDDFEVLICDDGSKDRTAQICDEYAAEDARVKVIHQVNQGQYLSRKTLIAQAEGEYILFVDADDWLDSELLEKTTKVAGEKNLDLVLFGFKVVDDEGNFIREYADLFEDRILFENDTKIDVLKTFVTSQNLNHLWDKLIRRELLTKESSAEMEHHGTGEDKLQLFPVFKYAERILYLAEPFYYYRLSVNGTSRNNKVSFLDDICYVNEKLYEFIKDMSLDTPEICKEFYEYFGGSIALYAIGTAHNPAIAKKDLVKAYKKTVNQDIMKKTFKRVNKIKGNRLMQITYDMLKHGRCGLLVDFLRFEKKIMHALKK